MMILKIPILALKHYLALANLIFILILFTSCKKEAKLGNSIVEKTEITSPLEGVLGDEHKGKKLIKQIDFENNGKKLNSFFLLKEEGEIGMNGFVKVLDVLIYENKNLLDKYSFENESPLCDLKILIEEIKILNLKKNQVLYFPIMHSCDGEEPNLLIANTWNGKKKDYKLEIPVYFEDSNSKNEFSENLNAINFKSNLEKNQVYSLISKLTKINLDNTKFKNLKVDKENFKCITKLDISEIKKFFSEPSKDKFSELFDRKDKINLETFINYLVNKKCLGQDISISEIEECSNSLKCEIYCSYDVTQEDIDDGELSEEIMYVYFNKTNGIITLEKLEFEGK